MSFSPHCGASVALAPARSPSPWVQRWLALLPPGATVLDFAAGSGRHAQYAHRRGLRATAIDRDRGALGELDPGPMVRIADLESGAWPFADERFDAVVVTNYLFRPRFALLAALVAPGGLLICETFAQGNERFGKPSNPNFLLAAGELCERSRRAGLSVVAYEHGLVEQPRSAVIQRVCATRPDRDGALRRLG